MSHIVEGEVFGFWLRLYGDGRGGGDLQTGGLVYLWFQLWVWRSHPNKHFDALVAEGKEIVPVKIPNIKSWQSEF